MAHLVAELQRLAEVGLVADNVSVPDYEAALAEALALSTVHVKRVLQEFRVQGVPDTRRNLVTMFDFEMVVAAGGFDPAYLHQIDGSRLRVTADQDERDALLCDKSWRNARRWRRFR
ncbi:MULTISPECIES: hypothetical protein [unclassified Bradyrhizobium]|uniref:hypothetical protein n=1 Tax=unclassified Bradyrhizobium TaxID=2631580 RepID=UPI0028E2C56A|nr:MULTISPECIES: hypothetical protein [unclassified Bradyrhizobium]